MLDRKGFIMYNTSIDNNKELEQMRPILLLAAILLTGCATSNTEYNVSNPMPEWLGKTARSGYKEYDPCFKCGEKWEQIPPQPFDAQIRYARGERW